MYKCKKCGNTTNFEEQNVVKTLVQQDVNGEIISTSDEFFYREDVVCLECGSTLNDGKIIEKVIK